MYSINEHVTAAKVTCYPVGMYLYVDGMYPS